MKLVAASESEQNVLPLLSKWLRLPGCRQHLGGNSPVPRRLVLEDLFPGLHRRLLPDEVQGVVVQELVHKDAMIQDVPR